jgi:hypothetical protein
VEKIGINSNQKTESSDTASTVGSSESNLPPAINSQSDRNKKCKHFKEEIKFWFEIFGLVAGLIVAYLIFLQFKEMQQTRILDERAWVAVREGVVGYTDESSHLTDFKFIFKNTGKTPAINVSVWFNQTVFLDTIPKIDKRIIPPIPFGSLGSYQFSGLLAPDAEGSISTSNEPLGSSSVQNINSGMPYYIYGTIWYDDIFGKHHWSQFCYQIILSPHAGFLPIGNHNSCDDAANE